MAGYRCTSLMQQNKEGILFHYCCKQTCFINGEKSNTETQFWKTSYVFLEYFFKNLCFHFFIWSFSDYGLRIKLFPNSFLQISFSWLLGRVFLRREERKYISIGLHGFSNSILKSLIRARGTENEICKMQFEKNATHKTQSDKEKLQRIIFIKFVLEIKKNQICKNICKEQKQKLEKTAKLFFLIFSLIFMDYITLHTLHSSFFLFICKTCFIPISCYAAFFFFASHFSDLFRPNYLKMNFIILFIYNVIFGLSHETIVNRQLVVRMLQNQKSSVNSSFPQIFR